MEANRSLEANFNGTPIRAEVRGDTIVLQFGGYDYTLKSADPHAVINMEELLPLFQRCIKNAQFQNNLSQSNLCEVELGTEKIDLYKKQGTATTHLETYVGGVAQSVNEFAMTRPPLAREHERASEPLQQPLQHNEGRREAEPSSRPRHQELIVERAPQEYQEPSVPRKEQRHVSWAENVEEREIPGRGDIEEEEEEEIGKEGEAREIRKIEVEEDEGGQLGGEELVEGDREDQEAVNHDERESVNEGDEGSEEEIGGPLIDPGRNAAESDVSVDAPPKKRFARVKEGFNALTEKIGAKFSSKRVGPENVEGANPEDVAEDVQAKLDALSKIPTRTIKRKSLVESKLTQAARQRGGEPPIGLSRKDYQPKFLEEISFLSKLKEIDLNNPVHVDKLTSFYAKLCVINKAHMENLIDLFADQGFYDAMQQVVDNLNALSNSSDSQAVKGKLDNIKVVFLKVAEKRQMMGQLIVNDLAGQGAGEWLKKFIDYDNPVETSKNLTKIVQTFMKGMNKDEDVPYEEKMEWASEGLKNLMRGWIREEADNEDKSKGVKALEYFLKVAKSSASRGDYFTASCIISAVPAAETLKRWEVGREKWRYSIGNAFSEIRRGYDGLEQVQLLKKAIIHPGYIYTEEMRFTQKLSVKELGKPFRFSALGKKLSKIELESNRLQKSGAQETRLDPTLTSKDFSLENFKEVQLLKKIRDLKDHGIPSKVEIEAWRRLCAKMQVIQQAQRDHPFLVIHLLENRDFLDVLKFGAEKFKEYGEESNAISTMFQGVLDTNRAYRQSLQPFGDGEDAEAKDNAIEAIRGYYDETERADHTAVPTFTFAYGDREFEMHSQVKTDVDRQVLFIDGQEIQRSSQSHEVLEEVFKTLEKQGYPSQNLGKITEMLTAQTFNGYLASKANREFGEEGRFVLPKEKGSNVCSVRQEGEDLVFTRNVKFNKLGQDPEAPPISVIETTFSIRIPRSKFTDTPFTIDNADVEMSYLFNEIPQTPGGV